MAEITAPAQWGIYHLAMFDESDNQMIKVEDFWMGDGAPYSELIFVLPICQDLTEDFESMTANSSTSDKEVQGSFVTWNFNKSGIRAPGEDRCNGNNAVMMKKPSTFYTVEPLSHNFFLGQATFFNPSTSPSKFTLEYSLDGGTTWEKAYTIDKEDAAIIPEKSRGTVRWVLNLNANQPANFRIAMTGGGTASNYVDDFVLYYKDSIGDVNADGAVNISDVNALISIILAGETSPAADVNGDGQVNIADVNAVINQILK